VLSGILGPIGATYLVPLHIKQPLDSGYQEGTNLARVPTSHLAEAGSDRTITIAGFTGQEFSS
jgi:hypothetical protein